MTSATLAAATPVTRDRYVDLLRVVSLATVVLGHWLMAVPVLAADGSIQVTNVLAVVPFLQPLTWLFQIMPLFFLVGGFAHATAVDSIRRRGGGYADFARSRAARLLRPTAVFLGVWLLLAIGAGLAGVDHGLVRVALRTVTQPLWFLGVYLGLIALAPAMLALHRRLGRWAFAVPLGLLLATAATDALRFTGHGPIAYVNLLFVWGAVHQLGFFYADGTLQRWGWPLALGGLTFLVTLTCFGPWPVSMVGVPGSAVSNMSPPTLALAAHACWLTGLAMLLRGPAARLLTRPRAWQAVVAGNGLAMTAFLWHLSAAFLVLGVLGSWPGVPVGSGSWWLTRPLWLGAAALVTAVLVAVFRRFDAPRPVAVTGGSTGRAAAGMLLCVAGIFAIATVGFGGLVTGRTAMMIAIPVTAPVSLALIAAGALLLTHRLHHRT